MSLTQGTQLNNNTYTIIGLLGLTECYEVGIARNNADGSNVIVYRLLDSLEGYSDQLQQKATAFRNVNNRYVAGITDVFTDGGLTCFATELEEGPTLAEFATGRPPMPVIKNLMANLADGVEAIHNMGLTHLALNPDNIIIRRDGSPLILGFTLPIPLFVDDDKRNPFAAPERYQPTGRNNPAHDIYSLGALLYMLTVGTRPPLPSVIESQGIEYSDDVDYDAADTIDKAMEPKAVNRFFAPHELVASLRGESSAGKSILSYKNVDTLPSPSTILSKQPIPQPQHEPQPEQEPQPQPQPLPEPEPEPEPEPQPEPEPEPEPQPEPEHQPIPEESDQSDMSDPSDLSDESENLPEPEPEPKPQPLPEPQPVPEPEPIKEPEPVKEAVPVQEPEPVQPENENEDEDVDKPSGMHKYWIIGIVAFGIIAGAVYMFVIRDSSASDTKVVIAPTIEDTTDAEGESASQPSSDAADENTVTDKPITVGMTTFTYTGDVNPNGEPEGTGKAVYESGMWKSYEGDWKNGVWEGEGRLIYANGDVYRGGFKGGMFTKGIYSIGADINNNGDYFSGTFKNGTPYDGSWCHADGKEFQKLKKGNAVN